MKNASAIHTTIVRGYFYNTSLKMRSYPDFIHVGVTYLKKGISRIKKPFCDLIAFTWPILQMISHG